MPGRGDRRDDTNWVVIELTRSGEQRAEEGTLARILQETLGVSEHPVFIPAATYNRSGNRVTIHLMEGYVFLAAGLSDVQYLALEEKSPYVKKVLISRGGGGLPVLSVLPDREVEEMRRKLREHIAADIEANMRVMVNQGTYAKLDGLVIDVDDEEARVLIELRSFKVIRSIPRVFLEPMEEECPQELEA